MNLKCTVVEKISKSSNNPYKCLEVEITPTYKKTVFLEKGEQELLNLILRAKNN